MKNKLRTLLIMSLIFNPVVSRLSLANSEQANNYLLPQFTKGKVYFKNGTVTEAQFNYSYRFGELQYIDVNKDTMSLTNKWTIRSVVIGKSTFYCSEKLGDMEMIVRHERIKLLKREFFKPVENVKDHSDRKFTASVNQPSSHYISAVTGEFSWQNNTPMPGHKAVTSFYFLDKNNDIQLAERKVILRLFTDNRTDIKEYISNENIKFNNEKDLVRLISFCLNLEKTEN